MTRSLVALSLGPVQEFIAAARRTADLYAGSQLLMELVGAAAGAFAEAERIFPADPQSGGANKLLAEVADDPGVRAAEAERRARQRLRELWQEHLPPLRDFIDQPRAEAQLEPFLEVYAAWVPLPEGGYAGARRKVEQLLAARKTLRDFSLFDQNDDGVPKSPLEPAFASVLKLKNGKVPAFLQEQPWNLNASEFLDSLSLLKWLYGKRLRDVRSTHDLAHAGASAAAKAASRFRPSREVDDDPENVPAYSYFAILVADGDGMGSLLSHEKNNDHDTHKKISAQLDGFAADAERLVRAHGGFPVYAGGDDVLALLPVTTALGCGEQLSKAFTKHLQAFQTADLTPTLSAGIALVHYREPLSTSLAHARAAEKTAKAVDGKDAVCVALHTRGGGLLAVAQQWAEAGRIQKFIDAELPRGLPHDLRELAREWPAEFDPSLLTVEARRIARRKADADGNKLSDETLNLWNFGSIKALETFSEQLILARFLGGRGDRA